MTATTKSKTHVAEQIVEAALALGPKMRAAVDEINRALIYRQPLLKPCLWQMARWVGAG